MQVSPSIRHLTASMAALLVSGLLSGCGGGKSNDASPTLSTPSSEAASAPLVQASAGEFPAEALMATEEAVAAEAAARQSAALVDSENATRTAAAQSDGSFTSVAGMPITGADTFSKALSASASTPRLTIKARSDIAGGVGAVIAVNVDGTTVGSVEIKSATVADYSIDAPNLKAGSKVDLVFTNDGVVAGVDRNFYLVSLTDSQVIVTPTTTGAVIDRGIGAAALDGLDVIPGQGNIYWAAAWRITWPAKVADPQWARKVEAVRFLTQATFGPTAADVNGLLTTSFGDWIAAQQALPYAPHYVNYVQGKYALGDAYRPYGKNYTPTFTSQKFWERAAKAPDQLRHRTAFALHKIFMVSLADSNLAHQGRAYANYVDLLHKNAFGNYRNLLEDMALSPAMGIYLSHIRNRKEDPVTGRMPDENFAREVMQLFTIGLHELNNDGSLKRDGKGNSIETYTNDDVLAMAKVFTGWSWGYPDSELTDANFLWGTPKTTAANDTKYDLQPMKAYASQHSTVEKKVFVGKSWALTLPAGNSAQADLKAALDTLFKHPNVGPFVSRQLIQHLVSSNPSPAYVGRVASVFNNNGNGVRGDLGAVVRAILLDTEARTEQPTGGKLREPVLRIAHWMRAMGATSSSGEYLLQWQLEDQGERALAAPSVFGYFRPGYVPSNSAFSARGATAPEFQIINESTVASWLNTAEMLAGPGLAWNVNANDVVASYSALAALARDSNLGTLPDHLNLMLLGGRMPSSLRQQIIDIMTPIDPNSGDGAMFRARAAVFLTLASPEFVVQN